MTAAPSPLVQKAFQLIQSGQHEQAAMVLQSALWTDPGNADVVNLLGVTMAQRGDLQAALSWFEEAVRLAPDAPSAWANRGNVRARLGQLEPALVDWAEAVRLHPDEPGVYPRMLEALYILNRFETAAAVVGEAVRRQTNCAQTALMGVASMMIAGHAGTIVQSLRRAEEQNGPVWQLLRPGMLPLCYWDGLSAQDLFREIRRFGMIYAASAPMDAAPHANDPDPERPLRIGYLSQDFRNQAAGHFVEPLITRRDRGSFQAFAYSVEEYGEDELTARVRASADAFYAVKQVPDDLLVHRIREDRIDILVDLIGYSFPDRLRVVSRKPAPIVVNYCGWPQTMGLAAVDYRLTDAVVDPPGTEALSTETLHRLDRCFMGYEPPHHMTDVVPREPPGPGRPPVFGCFNVLVKCQPSNVAAWARLLKRVPGSKLLMKNASFRAQDVVERVTRDFASHGVAADRLDLRAFTATREEHLRLYGEVDVALDPWPYNGATTTFEAMWMGVPVVALRGDRAQGRVSESVIRHAGFPEWLAKDADEYVEVAARLAASPEDLRRYRATLRERMRATVADGQAHCRSVEAFYRQAWRAWCASRPPPASATTANA